MQCVQHSTVYQKNNPVAHPLDVDDLRRDITFFKLVQPSDLPRMSILGEVSVQWAGIVKNWGDLMAAFEHSPETINSILNRIISK